MQGARELNQTPGLIGTDVADEIGSNEATIETRPRPIGTDRPRDAQIVERRALPNGWVVQPDRSRHPVAELRGVLNVVDAGIGILATEQEGREIAGKTLPRRGIGGSGLTEGEACELNEHIFDRDITAAGHVQQRAVKAAQLRSRQRRSGTTSES